MTKDTPIEEIISIMCAGEGVITNDGVEVFNNTGRPCSTDLNGYAYKTYAIGIDGEDVFEEELKRKLCLRILGKAHSISCMKMEGEEIRSRSVSILWRQKPEFRQDQNKSIADARCSFYVNENVWEKGKWID